MTRTDYIKVALLFALVFTIVFTVMHFTPAYVWGKFYR